jgi:hypothetical protein
MHKWMLLVLTVAAVGSAVAQSARSVAPQPDASAEMTSAQRRIDLRTALSAGRTAEQSMSAVDAATAGRQLSQQERAEMREQLRRYQLEASRPLQP